MRSFYLVCPLHFEDLVQQELKYKWPLHFPKDSYNILKADKGGVELECSLECGLLLNKILKIPGRIMLRVKKQKCRDLPKLFNIIKKINWKEYLRQENMEIEVTAKKSRLIHTTKIENTVLDALKAYFMANKIPQKKILCGAKPQKIYIRLFEDNLSISLDTSGELLHIRELNNYRGLASIRETYASALLLYLLGLKSYNKFTLLDPMCGSATFLYEAKNFFELNKRSFAFENWANLSLATLIDQDNPWSFSQLQGIDINNQVIQKQENSTIKITEGDLFKSQQNHNSIVILNPPYGKRIKIEGDLQVYFDSVVKHIQNGICPHAFGIIIPSAFAKKLKPHKRLKFNQNGIKVDF